jgi:hypothetical protein
MAKKQSLICPLYLYLLRDFASLDARIATIVIHEAILHGDVDANANNGVKTNNPMTTSWTDMRVADIIIRDDCAFRFNMCRSDAVSIMVDMDEVSCAGLSDDEEVGNSAWTDSHDFIGNGNAASVIVDV